jgi:hypothetical protein
LREHGFKGLLTETSTLKIQLSRQGSYTRDEKNSNHNRSEAEIAGLKNFPFFRQMNADKHA